MIKNLLSRLAPVSLGRKLFYLVAVICCLLLVNLLAYSFLLRELDKNAAAIDAAGRQRMLSQKIAYVALSAAAGKPGSAAQLDGLAAEFEDTITAFRRGGYSRDFYVAPAPPALQALVDREDELWKTYKAAVMALAGSAAGGRPSQAALRAIEAGSEPLLAASDDLTEGFRREASRATARMTLELLALTAFVLALGAGAVLFAFRKVTGPLMAMSGAARDLAAGNFTATGAEGSGGEIGLLSDTFSSMARKIGRDLDRQAALNRLLSVSAGRGGLDELLARLLDALLEIPWLKLESKGAVFLAEGSGRQLRLAAQRGLPPELLSACGRVPFGRCLCGRAAASGETVFSSGHDDRHETAFDGMPPHGHYCLPIKAGGAVAGVPALYVEAGHAFEDEERLFLEAAAAIMGKAAEYKALEARAFQAQKMESLGQAAGAVAHDFNNVLTVVRGFNELIQESAPEGSPARTYAEQAAAGIAKGAELARQILDYSRTKPQAKGPLDLGALVAGARPMLAMAAGSKIKLELELADNLPPVEANAGQLEQVLMNLTVNARDAIHPNTGRLTLRTFLSGGRPALAVTDTGCGMPPELAEKVFEPFFTTKPEGQGTGLGLSTVYSIVKAHGAEIAIDSAPGRGTTFTVVFPARAA